MGCAASTNSTANGDLENSNGDSNANNRPKIDEFEEETIIPFPPKDPKEKFKNGKPSMTGEEVSQCFENGLLFKIVQGNLWAFYNDTRTYEMRVGFTFGERSQLKAEGTTTISKLPNGEFLAETVVYPCETVPYISGTHAGFTSKIRAMPLSEEYLKRKYSETEEAVKADKEAMAEAAKGTEYTEEVLAACVQSGTKFIDTTFLPCQESIARAGERQMKLCPWGRPSTYLPADMADQVRLFRTPITPRAIDQGDLGDCWVMCSIAAIAEHPDKIHSLFQHPVDGHLTAKERAVGAYRVNLNKNGWWKSVIVDDYLPYIGSKPKFGKSSVDPCEMWVSILEKAYAKVHGSYAAITAGDPLHALQDMTGFPTTRYDESLENKSEEGLNELFTRLERYGRHGFRIILSTPSHDPTRTEEQQKYKKAGLFMDHAYSILQVKEFQEPALRLVQVRNPWGRGAEWTGAWGDQDSHWSEFPDVANACIHTVEEDGTFWMSWNDVTEYFTGCGVVFVYPQCYDYRVKTIFKNQIPNCVAQISVKKTVSLAVTLSQKDHRGSDTTGEEYPPIMVSLASGSGSTDVMQIVKNSNLDVDHPTAQFTFMQSREVGMLCELTPEESPYLLVPRIMSEGASDVECVLGLFSDEKIGSANFRVEFRELTPDNKVFENYPTYAGKSKPVPVEYQAKYPSDPFPQVVTGKEIIVRAPRKTPIAK